MLAVLKQAYPQLTQVEAAVSVKLAGIAQDTAAPLLPTVFARLPALQFAHIVMGVWGGRDATLAKAFAAAGLADATATANIAALYPALSPAQIAADLTAARGG